jgi:hypothetical protein
LTFEDLGITVAFTVKSVDVYVVREGERGEIGKGGRWEAKFKFFHRCALLHSYRISGTELNETHYYLSGCVTALLLSIKRREEKKIHRRGPVQKVKIV